MLRLATIHNVTDDDGDRLMQHCMAKTT